MRNSNLAKYVLTLLFCLPVLIAKADDVKGIIIDKNTNEPLIGASIRVKGTTIGRTTDVDGKFKIANLRKGEHTLIVSYISYKTLEVKVKAGKDLPEVSIALEADDKMLSGVVIRGQRNLESENSLLHERQESHTAQESMGAREMATKGVANVQEGVKKLTGISIATAGQLIVRGLGDRYSLTTLNGLSIASPNPDNKLIPLDLFPSSVVRNITVSKVYDVTSFADYSGAHIDICTKENITDDFFQISLNTGGAFNTLGKNRYQMDRAGTLWGKSSVDKTATSLGLADFDNYVAQHDIFSTTFDVDKKMALPSIGGNVSFGKKFDIGAQSLSILGSLSASNEYQNIQDAYYKTLEASGDVLSLFNYDSYTQHLKLAAFGHVGYTLRERDRIGYTFFYSRDANDTYRRNEGIDSEGHPLIGSHNVTHIYTLQNHQLNGRHFWGDAWELGWGGSYGSTGSDEPDRRQVMFIKGEQPGDPTLSLFKLNRQETMRYFGSLNEDEWNADVGGKWKWNENSHVSIGFNYKDKNRDYAATRYYYNLNNLSPDINGIYNTDDYLNQDNIANGSIIIERKMQPKDSYKAGNEIVAGYVSTDFYPMSDLLVNLGLRYEISRQWVKYASDGGTRYSKRRNLNTNDLFPTINLKFSLNDANLLRLSASRTVTRPAFIEMAPFLYQESYGAAQIRGNELLQNGYNYNLDARYEMFAENGDLLSVTGYYKHLDKPIERTQEVNGGATLHSFRNAESGMAAGVEVEFRKQIIKDLRLSANASFMYTNVKLPEGGAYTNKERSLQGASPVLLNADLTYTPTFQNGDKMDLALLYNMQGSRIHAVGIAQLGDIRQQAVHTLNFTAAYQFSERWKLNLKIDDLLNRAVVFKQEVPRTGEDIEVERYKKGTSFEVGVSFSL